MLANAGVDVFEEVFKLIFTKLYDEYLSREDKGIINYFLSQVTKTAVHEPRAEYTPAPSYLGEQDYEALKKAVEGIADERFRVMEFRNTGQTDTELEGKIQKLFDKAKERWRSPSNKTNNAQSHAWKMKALQI